MIVVGLGWVVVDFRANGFDLVPDLIGWGFVLSGLTTLSARSPWFTAAGVAAAFGVALGIPLQLTKAGPVLSAVEGVVLAVVIFGTCTGIRMVVASEPTRDTANLLRWSHLFVYLVGSLATLLVRPTRVTGIGGPFLVLGALVVFGLLAWLLVFLWSNREDPALAALSSRTQPEPVR
jgi:hypothetical protein